MPENPENIDMTLAEVVVHFDDESFATHVMLFSAVHRFVADTLRFYRDLKKSVRSEEMIKRVLSITYRHLESEGPYWWEGFDLRGELISPLTAN